MAKGIDRKSDPVLVGLIGQLKAAGREGAPIWRDIASRMEKPSRNWAQVNVSKVTAHLRDGENAVIAGKLLGAGQVDKAVTVIAYKASASAVEKIHAAGGKVLTMEEGVTTFPKGEKCRILGVIIMTETIIIDATGLVVGRMATHVAKKALEGNTVHIVNAEKAIITGSSKKAIQARYRFKREVGTARKGPFFPREPHLMVKRTIRGMIDYQKTSGREAYKRIQAHIGIPRELQGQDIGTVEGAARDVRTFMTVEEIARYLGAHNRMEA